MTQVAEPKAKEESKIEVSTNVAVKTRPEYRMYSLVLRQLSTMQKGVQTAHAVAEYVNKFHNNEDLKSWVEQDKTLIVLDGGTYPEMAEIVKTLFNLNVKFHCFAEPDLYNLTTAVCLLVPEQVWNKKDYIDFDLWCITNDKYKVYASNGWKVFKIGDDYGVVTEDATEEKTNAYNEYYKYMGGYKNVALRELLAKLRLAQ